MSENHQSVKMRLINHDNEDYVNLDDYIASLKLELLHHMEYKSVEAFIKDEIKKCEMMRLNAKSVSASAFKTTPSVKDLSAKPIELKKLTNPTNPKNKQTP